MAFSITSRMMDEYKEQILLVFNEFITFCKEHRLRYFCAYGTAIGAVRHHGFIPWDDDVDVFMPRPDYETFLKLYRQKKSEDFYTIDPSEDKHYYLLFAKLCYRHSSLLQFRNVPCVIGTYIDIFPLDGIDLNPQKIRSTSRRLRFYDQLFCWSNETSIDSSIHAGNFKSRCMRLLEYIVIKNHTFFRRYALNKYMAITTKQDYEKSDYVASYAAIVLANNVFPKKYFEDFELMTFANLMVRMPINNHEILSQIYGNYMQLPPIEQRKYQHNITFLDIYKQYNYNEILNLI
jgi:lipopolysaccharide cholinephosphotransferase